MIDWDKPIRRIYDKAPCRVIYKDLKAQYSMVIIVFVGGIEYIICCDSQGVWGGRPYFENISEKIYLNLYRYYDGSIGSCQYKTMEEGQKNCNCPDYIKTIEVEI